MYDPFLTAAVFLVICTVVLFPVYLNFRRRYQLTTVSFHPDPALSSKSLRIQGGFDPSAVPAGLLPVLEPQEDDEIIAWSDLSEGNIIEWLPEAESVLLSETEYVIGEVQDVLDHIASSPANPEEVTSKIAAIVSAYTILENTEYFEQVNNYISAAVKRNTGLELTTAEIHALWAA